MKIGRVLAAGGVSLVLVSGPTVFDIYTAIRNDVSAAWSSPALVTAISSEANEQAPRLSEDGQTLLFTSNRTGTLGGLDIWMATRAKSTGKQ